MDRTSIVGDTIDYTKELLEKINNLQEEMELGPNQLSLMSIFKNEKPIEIFVRNSPKVSSHLLQNPPSPLSALSSLGEFKASFVN